MYNTLNQCQENLPVFTYLAVALPTKLTVMIYSGIYFRYCVTLQRDLRKGNIVYKKTGQELVGLAHEEFA